MSSPYFKLFHRFGILPRDEELYTLAFTHPSCNASAGTKHVDYERLEFLGDAIVGAVVADLCYRLHPEMDEGGLTQIKNQLVQSQSEASLCLFLGLDEYIRVGNNFASSNPMSGGAMSKAEKALYENVFESFIGAMYLDQGMTFTYRFLHDLFFKRVQDAKIELDPKSELQHHCRPMERSRLFIKFCKKTERRRTPMWWPLFSSMAWSSDAGRAAIPNSRKWKRPKMLCIN